MRYMPERNDSSTSPSNSTFSSLSAIVDRLLDRAVLADCVLVDDIRCRLLRGGGRSFSLLRELALPLLLHRQLAGSLRVCLRIPCCHTPPLSIKNGGSGRDRRHVGRLRALRALLRLVLHPRVLGERLVPLADDRGVVDEQVLAAVVGRDEPIPLVRVEPLHGSGGHPEAPPPLLRNGQRRRKTRIRYSLVSPPILAAPRSDSLEP